MTGTRRLARVAGLLYLIVALTAVFAELVRARIVTPGDAAATADSIRASATLFRVGFVTDLVQATCFLLTAMLLYRLLRHVNRPVAAAMVTFVAVSVAIMCLNALSQLAALLLAAGGVGYLVDLFAQFLAPGVAGRLAPFVLAPATVGEVAFVAWLLVKAVRVPAIGSPRLLTGNTP
jgi:hypothetical protein